MSLFIYLFEDYGKPSTQVSRLRESMLARGDQLVTSTMTIGEVLVKPRKMGDSDLCQPYENAIRTTAVLIDFNLTAARNYAHVRANHPRKIAPPDAIQLACAAAAGVDLFLTNDTRLHGVHLEGIHCITSLERAPL
jgi:predicted nucleic acid-binding protein